MIGARTRSIHPLKTHPSSSAHSSPPNTSTTARPRHQGFLRFLKKVESETDPDLDLHFILDNYATHKHGKVQTWLKRHQRLHLHFIPTSSSC